jgi:ribosomal protein L1
MVDPSASAASSMDSSSRTRGRITLPDAARRSRRFGVKADELATLLDEVAEQAGAKFVIFSGLSSDQRTG